MFRVIKVLAIVLASFIVVAIVGALISGVSIVDGITRGQWIGSKPCTQSGACETENFNKDVAELDISVKATSLRIINDSSKEVQIETNNEYVERWIDGETLHIVEKSHGIFGLGGKGEVVLKIPEGKKFDKIKVEVGAGMLTAETLAGKIVEMKLGAGKTEIEELIATSSATVDGGAGVLDILGGEVNNADVKIGAGKAAIKLKLVGTNNVNTGVGRLDLTLIGKKSDYMLEISKGIGSVTVAGEDAGNNSTWSDGSAKVKLSSGVGAVEVKVTN